MYEELEALLNVIENIKTYTLGNRTFYKGSLNNQNVVLVFSKWGKVSASITTTQLISEFNPSEIIFTGVAGAINSNLNIGDIVYGQQLIQHDMDASPLFPKYEIPLLGCSHINTSENKKLENSMISFQHQYSNHINIKEAKQFNISLPTIHKGLIASGDEFIDSKEKQMSLLKDHPSLLCVEMEGAAVAQVCLEYKIPFHVIRIISDKADQNAPIDFPVFTKKIASKYAKGILENYCS